MTPTDMAEAVLPPAEFVAQMTATWEGPWASAADTIIQALRAQAASVEPVDALHKAVCKAVELLAVSPEIARISAGREVSNVLRQALVDYADAFMDQPVTQEEREAVASNHRTPAHIPADAGTQAPQAVGDDKWQCRNCFQQDAPDPDGFGELDCIRCGARNSMGALATKGNK